MSTSVLHENNINTLVLNVENIIANTKHITKKKCACNNVRFQFFCLTAEYNKHILDTKNKQKPIAKNPLATKNEPVIPEKTPTNSMTFINNMKPV